MDLINLALKFKDYEWAKELFRMSQAADSKSPDKNKYNGMTNETEGLIALEDIINQYAIKEKDGLRNFNINSEYDRNTSELVIVNGAPHHKGEKVNYVVPTKEELDFLHGLFQGYLMGIEEAYKNLNSQISSYFNAVERQINSTKEKGVKKQVKTRKSKTIPD